MSTLFADSMPVTATATDGKAQFLTVYGRPQPQGSSRAFYVKSLGRSVVTSANKNLKPWRQQITETALTLGAPCVEGPVRMEVDFYFARPKSAKKRVGMTTKPDVDKLLRAIFDSLTGVLFKDDSQVVDAHPRKFYGDPERVEIRVSPMELKNQ